MSVQYSLSKVLTIKDLLDRGYNVEKSDGKNEHPYVVNDDIAIRSVDDVGLDNPTIIEFEGRFSKGGINTIFKICRDFNCLFLTDVDIDDIIQTAVEGNFDEIVITKEDYINKAKEVGLDGIDFENVFDDSDSDLNNMFNK